MAYAECNFRTKKALVEAVAQGKPVKLINSGIGGRIDNGIAYLEGPHYPKPHTWYAKVQVKDGLVVRVLK